jgi:CubicO group peptidase (beta-lactamase class C family)
MFRRSALSGVLALALFAAISGPLAAAKKNDPVAAFDALAEKARQDWGVPGLAVVVVRDGRVLLAKGYGVRELGRPDTVDADTLFAAASTTKAMTCAAIGMLVDEGKLGWDDLVRKYIPELRFADPALSDSLTVRDLLTHHTGLPNTDYLWYSGEIEWKEMVARLARVERSAPTRSRFEYQNVMYGLAGELVGRVAGTSWQEFVRRRIFTPVGMSRTVPLGQEAMAEPNHVTPHSREDGSLATFETLGLVDPIPAAGSVWISANDEAKWMRFLLDPGSVKDAAGAPLLRPETIEELFRPQVVIQPGGFYPTVEKTKPHWTTYGLAWFQQDYRGRKIDFHTGSIDGLVAIVGLAREERFGVAVFGNLDHAELRHALMFSAFDLFLDGGLSRDWNGELRAMYDDLRKQGEAQRTELEAKRVPNAPPAHPLAAYTGTYTDPLYGEVRFELAGEALVARIGRLLVGRAEPWSYETFRIVWQRKLDGVSWANFATDGTGSVAAVEIDGTKLARQKEPAARPAGAGD